MTLDTLPLGQDAVITAVGGESEWQWGIWFNTVYI